VVEVAWMHDHHDEDELDFPTEEGAMTIGGALGMRVLWNKAYIFLEMPKLASQPSSSPPGGPSDDDDDNSGDDNGGDGNGNDGGLGSTMGGVQHSRRL
jgi:hypothetical protein